MVIEKSGKKRKIEDFQNRETEKKEDKWKWMEMKWIIHY